MRKVFLIALSLFVLGVTLLAVSVVQGGGKVYLALIFPVYAGSDVWGFFGFLCIIGAFFVGFMGLVPAGPFRERSESLPPKADSPEAPGKRFGGVVMLGPIPLVVGSDMKMSIVAIALAIILVIILIVSMVLFIPGLMG